MKCPHLFRRAGCRSNHSEDEKDIAQKIFILGRHYENMAVAYADTDGSLTLYRFPMIPVHMMDQSV